MWFGVVAIIDICVLDAAVVDDDDAVVVVNNGGQ